MERLPETGTYEEVRDARYDSWDSYEVVEYLRAQSVDVLAWNLRRGWAKVEVDWNSVRNAFDVDNVEACLDHIRSWSMAHNHFTDHADIKHYQSRTVLALFFKRPINDDPEQIGRASCRERVCQYV